jgi:hypothetical protein
MFSANAGKKKRSFCLVGRSLFVVSFRAHAHDHTLNLRFYNKETGNPAYALL